VKRERSATKGTAAKDSLQSGDRLFLASVCAAIVLETLFFWPEIGNAFIVPKTVVVLIAAAALVPQIGARLLAMLSSRSRRILLGLCGAQLIAITWATINSISPAVSFWGGDWRRMGWITQFGMLCIAMAVPLAIKGESKRWRLLLWTIAGAGAISAGYGVLQWMGWDPFLPESMRAAIMHEFGGQYRSSGTIGQPTYFATVLIYAFFATLAVAALESGAKRLLAGAMLALIAAALVLTGARSGWLGCAVGVAILATVVAVGRMKTSGRMITAAALILIAMALFAGGGLEGAAGTVAKVAPKFPGMSFVSARLEGKTADSASISRIILWSDVTRHILPAYWISGAGPGMFRVAFMRHRSDNYTEFDPDVHWESAHNLFLDRFTEQGILGLLVTLAWIAACAHAVIVGFRRAPSPAIALACLAIGSGLAAAVASQCFNGEVVPTTTYFYVWVAMALALRECIDRPQPSSPGQGTRYRRALIAAAAVLSIGLIWHAQRNWRAERALRAGEEAFNAGNAQRLLEARTQAEGAMPQVGVYHAEFSQLISAFLGKPRPGMTQPTRLELAAAGIASGEWAVPRTDKPMMALQNLIVLADLTGDPRIEKWNNELMELDPLWFRPHENSARLLLRQGKVDEALREATAAHSLAPYITSAADIWIRVIAIQRDRQSK
jgi:O-antigen ligase